MSQSTGCSQPELLERLYQHFAQPGAWDVYPGARDALKKIRATGMPQSQPFTIIAHLCCSRARAGSPCLPASHAFAGERQKGCCACWPCSYVLCMTCLDDQHVSVPRSAASLYDQHMLHYPAVAGALCEGHMHAAGTKMAVVSNFDLRLRPLLEALGLDQLFDALIISAEVSLWLLLGSC